MCQNHEQIHLACPWTTLALQSPLELVDFRPACHIMVPTITNLKLLNPLPAVFIFGVNYEDHDLWEW